MEFQDYLADHINFILVLSFYFLPSITGAALTTFIKYSDKCDHSAKCTSKTIILMFFSALVPAIVLTAINDYMCEIIQSTYLRIGIAFIFGCVGDETLEIVTSLRKMSGILKVLSKHIENLKKISNAAGDIISELNKDQESESGTKDDDNNNPPESFDDPDDFYLE